MIRLNWEVGMVRIRFTSEEDETNGFYILATQASLRGLRGGVYEIADESLTLLEKNSIKYSIIPPSEVTSDEAQADRNPLTVEP